MRDIYKNLTNKQIYLVIILFAALLFTYLYNLDSDPSIIKRSGDIADEGYWVHNARIETLFSNYKIDEFKMSIYTAPLFYKFTLISFNLFGVNFFSSRLVSVFSLWITVIIIFLILKKKNRL